MRNSDEAPLFVSEAELSISIFEVIFIWIANATRSTALHDIDLDRPAKRFIAESHQSPIARNFDCYRA